MSNTDMVTLTYDLNSLPTAQHKAGLAGFVMLIESMERRGIEPRPRIAEVTPHGATFAFTREELQALFDDFYDAMLIEVARKSKWANMQEKRIEEEILTAEDGSTKTEKRYVYDLFQPKGIYLTAYYPDDGNGPWLKLWRDMLWATLRGIPKTRTPYQERLDGKNVSLSTKVFDSLSKSTEARSKGKTLTESISSSMFIGAQNVSAEKVPFVGLVEHNLLLHFWTVVSLYYVPRILKRDGKLETKGFVIVIPEPADLNAFIEDVQVLLKELDPDISGFRPKASLIDVPEEGGLEYLCQFTLKKIKESVISYSIASVELYHLHKQGNNIKNLSADRIIPGRYIIENYNDLRTKISNPLYKAMRIGNLLADKPWYAGAEELFNAWPREMFVAKQDDPPRYFYSFGGDVRKKFKDIEEDQKFRGGDTLAEQTDDRLALHVYRLIRAYVNYKSEAKSGKNYDDFKNNQDDKGKVIYPREYAEARGRVCTDAFLAMRGRRDQNFIEYFTGTICSVPQWLPEEDYLAVSQALISEWEKVKTLSMLALSAHSYAGRNS
ncbi:MAG: type I-MYXAN CRISPR-associated protein Cmx8 [Bacillota bacterium]|nr:type I-MYXAN CRISPR-associated protein Cmx8 [Bacillota bacterium]